MNPTRQTLTGNTPQVPAKPCPILIIGTGGIVKDAHPPAYRITNTGEFRVSEGTDRVGTNFLPNVNVADPGAGAKMDRNFTGKVMVNSLDIFGIGPLPTGTYGSTHPIFGSYFTGTASVVRELQEGFDNASRRVIGGTSGALTNFEDGHNEMTRISQSGGDVAERLPAPPAPLDSIYPHTLGFSR